MSDALKRCPFAKCGGEGQSERGGKGWRVYCTQCHFCSPNGTAESEAIAAWNDRTPEPWLPIETAPKDGTPVLVCLPDENPYFVWWHDPTKQWVRTRITDPLKSPTHWLPLPAPPSKEAA